MVLPRVHDNACAIDKSVELKLMKIIEVQVSQYTPAHSFQCICVAVILIYKTGRWNCVVFLFLFIVSVSSVSFSMLQTKMNLNHSHALSSRLSAIYINAAGRISMSKCLRLCLNAFVLLASVLMRAALKQYRVYCAIYNTVLMPGCVQRMK